MFELIYLSENKGNNKINNSYKTPNVYLGHLNMSVLIEKSTVNYQVLNFYEVLAKQSIDTNKRTSKKNDNLHAQTPQLILLFVGVSCRSVINKLPRIIHL